MKTKDIKKIAPYEDVSDILVALSEGLEDILGDQLVGLYLTGSLTYGDFKRWSSDIDFLVILTNALSKEQRGRVKSMHDRIRESFPIRAERIEGSYIPKDWLQSAEPPETSRPYINGGKFWDPDPVYGNEWLLNLNVLYECGVALLGPDPKTLIGPVRIELVREASKKDLHEEWEPKLKDPSYLPHSHHQAYIILTMRRILHRAQNENVASKRTASAWVKKTYGMPWSSLIEKAENWQYGEEMNAHTEMLHFIGFVLKEVG